MKNMKNIRVSTSQKALRFIIRISIEYIPKKMHAIKEYQTFSRSFFVNWAYRKVEMRPFLLLFHPQNPKKQYLHETLSWNRMILILFIIWMVFHYSNGNCNLFQFHIILITDYLYEFWIFKLMCCVITHSRKNWIESAMQNLGMKGKEWNL